MKDYLNTGTYIRLLWDDLRSNMENELKKRGYGDITPSHGWIFHNTSEEGSRITELAAFARITKQSMSALVSQLEENGYVKKKPDESDKRAWVLVLTPKGKKARDAGHDINYQFEKKWEAKLGRENYAHFRKLLQELCS